MDDDLTGDLDDLLADDVPDIATDPAHPVPSRRFRGWEVGPDSNEHVGRAALRDASWFDHPGRGYRYHIVALDGGSACQGQPLILDYGVRDPGEIEAHLRCHRNGCRGRWPGNVAPAEVAERRQVSLTYIGVNGATLFKHRTEKRLTQQDLACMAAVSQAMIVRLEAGGGRTRPANVQRIADALALRPEVLCRLPGSAHQSRGKDRAGA